MEFRRVLFRSGRSRGGSRSNLRFLGLDATWPESVGRLRTPRRKGDMGYVQTSGGRGVRGIRGGALSALLLGAWEGISPAPAGACAAPAATSAAPSPSFAGDRHRPRLKSSDDRKYRVAYPLAP